MLIMNYYFLLNYKCVFITLARIQALSALYYLYIFNAATSFANKVRGNW